MQATNPYFEAYYVNTEIQKEHILGNILGYFVVVLRTYMSQFNSLLLNLFAGTNMYHSQLPVYSFISGNLQLPDTSPGYSQPEHPA